MFTIIQLALALKFIVVMHFSILRERTSQPTHTCTTATLFKRILLPLCSIANICIGESTFNAINLTVHAFASPANILKYIVDVAETERERERESIASANQIL